MRGFAHNLQAVGGTEPEFLHEHADEIHNRRQRFRRAVHGQVAGGARRCGDGDRADGDDMAIGCSAIEHADSPAVSQCAAMRLRDDVDGFGEPSAQPYPGGGSRACHGSAWQQRCDDAGAAVQRARIVVCVGILVVQFAYRAHGMQGIQAEWPGQVGAAQ